jgi:hypothetical protein
MADEQKGTAYVVLRELVLVGDGATEDGPGVAWQEIGRVTAPNDLAAIKAVVPADDPLDGACVAVPARSWRPRKPKDETIQKRLWQ